MIIMELLRFSRFVWNLYLIMTYKNSHFFHQKRICIHFYEISSKPKFFYKGNKGCNGGWMDQAFEYVKENGGIDTEDSYPYRGVNGVCMYNQRNSGATDSGYIDIPENDEDKLQEAIASVGPISVAIDASHDSFRHYESGTWKKNFRCFTRDLIKDSFYFILIQVFTTNRIAMQINWTTEFWLLVTELMIMG